MYLPGVKVAEKHETERQRREKISEARTNTIQTPITSAAAAAEAVAIFGDEITQLIGGSDNKHETEAASFITGTYRQPNEPEIVRALNMARVKRSPLYGEITDAALIDMLPPLPDTSALIEAVKKLGGYIPAPGYRDIFNYQCFTIEGRQVEFIPEEVKRVAAPYSVTAETEGELQRLALATKVIEALQEIRKLYPDIPADSLIISGLVTVGLVDGRLFASPQFVQTATVTGGGRRGVGSFNNEEAAAVFKKAADQTTLPREDMSEEATARLIAERRNTQKQY